MSLLMHTIENCVELPMHGNFGQDRDSPMEDRCAAFLSKLEDVSEHQPDSEEVHLVERMRKIDCYEAMVEGS